MRVCLLSLLMVLNLGLVPIQILGLTGSSDWAGFANAQTVGSFAERRLDTVSRPFPGPFDYSEPEDEYAAHSMWHLLLPRTYHAYVGYYHRGERLRPTVVLLHGSGRGGASMIDMWRRVADENDLVLVAPDSAMRRGWSPFLDTSGFLDRVLDHAAETYPIDREQIYVFGHSAGAVHATGLARENALNAVAFGAHAGFPKHVGRSAVETRAPISFFLGQWDQLFAVEDARATGQALAANGHDVTLAVLPNHSHWYYADGPAISRDAWRMLQRGGRTARN